MVTASAMAVTPRARRGAASSTAMARPCAGHGTTPTGNGAIAGLVSAQHAPTSATVEIVSTYLSHAVYRGVVRGRILAAPTDSPVIQGRLALEMAVRALEGSLATRHAGPPISIMTPETSGDAVVEGSLAPASFVPVFTLESDD